jgi:hypothetical protein
MAKLALINREQKRADLVAKFAAKRAALKAIIDDQSKSEEERYEAVSATAARSPVAHVAPSVNSAWVVSSSVNSPCAAKSRV